VTGRGGSASDGAPPTWYVDGNNLAGALGLRGPGDTRIALLNRLLAHRLPRPIVVVFDGPPAAELASRSGGTVRVLFSGPRVADDLIAARLRPGDRVVTRDRGLALRARDRQARPVDPEAFMDSLRPLRRSPSGEKPEPGGDIGEWMDLFTRREEE
jgi:hypothetical protein